jgi:transposase
VQRTTEENVELAYVDHGYMGEAAIQAASQNGIQLEVVKHAQAKRGFLLLLRRWVAERSFAWAARFRRLVRDYERLADALAGFHYFAFARIMLAKFFNLLNQS